MDTSNSTVDGNISTIEKLLEQTGLAELQDEHLTVDVDPYAVMFRGDLGTGEGSRPLSDGSQLRTHPATGFNMLLL
jgi:hypothetical protein